MIARLHGHLRMECITHKDHRTVIGDQSVKTPFHLSKPYWDGHVLVVQVVNPTAGLFSGDFLESKVEIRRGAKVLMTSPSASRIHASRGGFAELRQTFHVESGAWLEYTPSALIPQKDARYRQRTDLDIDQGGEVYWMEILAPGRCAHGENLAYRELDWGFNIRVDHVLVGRERFTLNRDNGSMKMLAHPIPNAWYASGFIISEKLGQHPAILDELRSIHDTGVHLGISEMSSNFWIIRMLAGRPEAMRRSLAKVRPLLSGIIPELKAQIRW